MALPGTIDDREFQSFQEVDGLPAKRLVVVNSAAIPVTVSNPVSTVTVANPVSTVTVANPVSAVSILPTALTPSSPAAATVGTSSAVAVAANANRKGLVLVNTSASIISISFGAAAAVVGSGITLLPNMTWVMTRETLSILAVNAIAAGVSSNLAVQEFT